MGAGGGCSQTAACSARAANSKWISKTSAKRGCFDAGNPSDLNLVLCPCAEVLALLKILNRPMSLCNYTTSFLWLLFKRLAVISASIVASRSVASGLLSSGNRGASVVQVACYGHGSRLWRRQAARYQGRVLRPLWRCVPSRRRGEARFGNHNACAIVKQQSRACGADVNFLGPAILAHAVACCAQICVAISCGRCEPLLYHQGCIEKYLKKHGFEM